MAAELRTNDVLVVEVAAVVPAASAWDSDDRYATVKDALDWFTGCVLVRFAVRLQLSGARTPAFGICDHSTGLRPSRLFQKRSILDSSPPPRDQGQTAQGAPSRRPGSYPDGVMTARRDDPARLHERVAAISPLRETLSVRGPNR
jgi:hypothetical protein